MDAPAADGELLVPFPLEEASLGVAGEVRSTLIASSMGSLRRRDLFPRYEALLDPRHRDAVLGSVAGQWLPMDVGHAHYEACDRLGLSVLEQVEIGADVSLKIHDTFLGVVIRTAKHAGVTPWPLLERGNTMYSRLFQGGGGVRVYRHGPKEARADVAGVPLLAVPYFRNAIRGLYQAAVGLFCTRAYVHEIPVRSPEARVALRVSWA